MADLKYAELIQRIPLGNDAALLEFELDAKNFQGVLGGKYFIVNSGAVDSAGKALKRAYSILAYDEAKKRVQIAVQAIPEGPTSKQMTSPNLDKRLAYSGPWGKLHIAAIDPNILQSAKGYTIVASFTGITAALSLAQDLKREFPAQVLQVHWLRPNSNYFLGDRVAAEILGPQDETCSLITHDIKLDSDPAKDILSLWPQLKHDSQFFACGDGRWNRAIQEKLAQQVEDSICFCENFFNKPT